MRTRAFIKVQDGCNNRCAFCVTTVARGSAVSIPTATVLIICTVLVVLIDTLLKPVLLGRKADAPMLVVLIGAIGGMMLAGIVGLFVGAVFLTLGWELLQHSLKAGGMSENETPPPAQETAESSDQG